MAADFRIRLQYCLVFLMGLQFTRAFYIPGWSVKSYADGDAIPLLVNKVYSDTTQIQHAFAELPFVCPPTGKLHGSDGLASGSNIALNIGEVLRGDRIVVSDYELRMGKDEELRHLCHHTIDKAGLWETIDLVKKGYVAEWIVDNLPGATSYTTVDNTRKYYAAGFKLGYQDSLGEMGRPRYFLNNHVTLVIRWHRASGRDGDQGRKVIVGFEVYAKSLAARDLDHATSLPPNVDDGAPGFELSFASNSTNSTVPSRDQNSLAYIDTPVQSEDARLTIPYTYSVYYREEPGVEWANRWDRYFENQEDNERIHWLAIVNSLVIAGLLSAVVIVILARTIRGDIKGYRDGVLEDGKLRLGKRNPLTPPRSTEKGGLLDDGEAGAEDLGSDDESADDTAGWKLIHGDVFRTPSFGYLLAPLIGSGMQLVFMAVGLISLSCIGWLNPSFRGGFVSVGFALFLVAGVFSGYFSARIYKTFGGTLWKHNAVVTATLFPGLLFSTMFVLNLFVWAQASSTALPLGTLLGLVTLWLLVQVPLVYFGSWYGFVRVGPYVHPIKATVIPRQIPKQSWYSRRMQTVAMAGLVPFAVIFIELLFVFQSLWLDKSGYYYVFGFLAVTSTILILAVMETTVIAVYIQLCAEDHHWWWQSFLTGSSSSIWIFFYCIYYYARYLHITGLASTLLFFAYSFLACAVYGLLAGTIGFLTAYAFVRRIYGAIKVD